MDVTTIGFDIAKGVFQVHGVDAAGEVVLRRRLSRGQVLSSFERLPPCLVGMEACGSAHHWARAISALGHDIRLISPAYVKPYVKRSKTDAADAAAICEAVTVYDQWHYVPVLAKKPGALRNGAPFKHMALPPALERLRGRLKGSDDGDRQIVKILTAVMVDGLDAVDAAAAEALAQGVTSADIVLNILARSRSAPVEPSIATPEHLRLSIEPTADAGRYDRLLAGSPQSSTLRGAPIRKAA